METKKNLTIAVLMGDTYNEYATELINGFYSCAQKENINLIFLMRSSLPRDTNSILSDMTGEDFQVHFSSIYDYVPLVKPDALILAYGSLSIFSDTPEKELLYSYFQGIPCLLLKDISDNPDIPYLVADNYVGMRDCIEHLVSVHNYQKIAFLAGPRGNHDSNERLRAYYDVMEKYGLSVTDSMVTHGDYSESVEAQVNYLLDSNPGLEAIAFANDNMAKAGYRVCNERGLVVGRDLAITGFDDVEMAKTMNPPLTSVMHSSFLFSYQALQNAIQLCKGGTTMYNKLPTLFHPRSSCGCKHSYSAAITSHSTRDEIVAFLRDNIKEMVDDFFFSIPYQEGKEQYEELLLAFFKNIAEQIYINDAANYNFETQSHYLKKLCNHPRISPLIMLEHVVELLKKLVAHTLDESERATLLRVISSTQQYVHSNQILIQQAQAQLKLHQNWFVNSFTQDLLKSQVNLGKSLQGIMKRLQLMNIQSCYFFLLSEPEEYDTSFRLQLPDNLYLAAYYNEKGTVQLERPKWIHINSTNGITDNLPQDKPHLYTTYVLFSGKTQYGFLLCENNPQNIPFMLTCSLHIGSFLHFYSLNANEREIRSELELSLKMIREQNSILNFISEYDELTKLLNRRGFLEKSIHAVNDNLHKTAYVLSADLDHLKEINDCFGHSAGDFALQAMADTLRECLPNDAVIGRIGGDEFVAFIVSNTENFDLITKQAIKDYTARFNENSNKPYYIEASIGIYKCSCNPTISMTDLINRSDILLYEDKKRRRSTVKK